MRTAAEKGKGLAIEKETDSSVQKGVKPNNFKDLLIAIEEYLIALKAVPSIEHSDTAWAPISTFDTCFQRVKNNSWDSDSIKIDTLRKELNNLVTKLGEIFLNDNNFGGLIQFTDFNEKQMPQMPPQMPQIPIVGPFFNDHEDCGSSDLETLEEVEIEKENLEEVVFKCKQVLIFVEEGFDDAIIALEFDFINQMEDEIKKIEASSINNYMLAALMVLIHLRNCYHDSDYELDEFIHEYLKKMDLAVDLNKFDIDVLELNAFTLTDKEIESVLCLLDQSTSPLFDKTKFLIGLYQLQYQLAAAYVSAKDFELEINKLKEGEFKDYIDVMQMRIKRQPQYEATNKKVLEELDKFYEKNLETYPAAFENFILRSDWESLERIRNFPEILPALKLQAYVGGFLKFVKRLEACSYEVPEKHKFLVPLIESTPCLINYTSEDIKNIDRLVALADHVFCYVYNSGHFNKLANSVIPDDAQNALCLMEMLLGDGNVDATHEIAARLRVQYELTNPAVIAEVDNLSLQNKGRKRPIDWHNSDFYSPASRRLAHTSSSNSNSPESPARGDCEELPSPIHSPRAGTSNGGS